MSEQQDWMDMREVLHRVRGTWASQELINSPRPDSQIRHRNQRLTERRSGHGSENHGERMRVSGVVVSLASGVLGGYGAGYTAHPPSY